MTWKLRVFLSRFFRLRRRRGGVSRPVLVRATLIITVLLTLSALTVVDLIYQRQEALSRALGYEMDDVVRNMRSEFKELRRRHDIFVLKPDQEAAEALLLWYDIMMNRLDVLDHGVNAHLLAEVPGALPSLGLLAKSMVSMEPELILLLDAGERQGGPLLEHLDHQMHGIDIQIAEFVRVMQQRQDVVISERRTELITLYSYLSAAMFGMILSAGLAIFLLFRQSRELAEKNLALQTRTEELQEAKLKADDGSRSKSAFLANISHELRTPLNAIIGFSELLQHQVFGKLTDRNLEYVQAIHSSGRHLFGLVEQILDMSRIEAGKLEMVDERVDLLTETRQAAILAQAGIDRQGVNIELPETGGILRADTRAVRQMLINLLGNALKFTPEGGEVCVEIEQSAQGTQIRVKDTGMGMPEGEIERALAPFSQLEPQTARKFGGLGLGLPITHSLIERHGGDLSITSSPGVGTIVTLTFPAERNLQEDAPAVAEMA